MAGLALGQNQRMKLNNLGDPDEKFPGQRSS